MLAKLTAEIPAQVLDDRGEATWLYEPKWDGFRCIVFRDGDDIELSSRNERPFTRYFPELLDPLRAALAERCVVDGEIVIAHADDRGLDFDALLQRDYNLLLGAFLVTSAMAVLFNLITDLVYTLVDPRIELT